MKPKREIKFSEVQDQCIKRGGFCTVPDLCQFKDICTMLAPDGYEDGSAPSDWDLTDPPRFTEAQMALLKALWNLGVKKVSRENNDQCFLGDAESWEMSLRDLLDLKYGTIDLAELFGKE